MKCAKEKVFECLNTMSEQDLLADFNSTLGITDDVNELETDCYEHIDLHFSGESVSWGKISARVLGNTISGFQKIVDDLGNALDNNASSSGPIPMELLRQTELMVNAPYAAPK